MNRNIHTILTLWRARALMMAGYQAYILKWMTLKLPDCARGRAAVAALVVALAAEGGTMDDCLSSSIHALLSVER